MEDVQLPMPVEEIDIDQDRDAANKFGIRGVPTLVIVDDAGVEVRRMSGMLMEKQLLDFVNK
jgi:thioredoxin 1